MRQDFRNLNDGDRITLFPLPDNPLHDKPVRASFYGGYFYCDDSIPEDGPDYYLGDVLRYNEGYETALPPPPEDG